MTGSVELSECDDYFKRVTMVRKRKKKRGLGEEGELGVTRDDDELIGWDEKKGRREEEKGGREEGAQ